MHRITLDTRVSQRYEDSNGFLCIRHNPIAKAGVFEYLGENLGKIGNDANKIYRVYRPFEELKKTAKEFEGMPITLDHHWVEGDERNPEVMGLISGKVTAEEPYLYADIKIINEKARKAIESGEMQELSPGYTSQFIEEPGEYNGDEYSFRQYDMHYNHLALVDVGRSGPDLKIMDSNIQDLPISFWGVADSLKDKKFDGGQCMSKRRRTNDVDIDRLAALLVDFFNEEKQEPAHEEDTDIIDNDVMTDSDSMDEPIVVDEGEDEPIVVDEGEDEPIVVDEGEDEPIVVAEDEGEDEPIVVAEDEGEDEPIVVAEDEGDEVEVQDSAYYNYKMRSIADAAIKSYKAEHAKAMKAYDEVSPVVGSFKTYDLAGGLLSERAIYVTACRRLGIDKIDGVTDFKTAFKVASVMRAKYGKDTNVSKVQDSVDERDSATVDSIIKNAFRI